MCIFRWAWALTVLAALVGAPAQADDSDEILVVTHIDVIPTFLTQAQPLIEAFVLASRNDPGAKQFILVSWDGITNHFQLIERFQNMRAFDAHVSAAHTVKFRKDLQPFIGAPYDERLYQDGEE